MGRKQLRVTTQMLKVLGALISNQQSSIAGAEIARVTGLASGTLYPILLRLENGGWVTSHWEDGDPHELCRPRRRLYRLTGLGAKKARSAFDEVRVAAGSLAWT